jgi:hypothetical protein
MEILLEYPTGKSGKLWSPRRMDPTPHSDLLAI